MKAPRSVVHVSSPSAGAAEGVREFLSVAVRISCATGGKDGFFVQLFSDAKAPQAIYVTSPQLERLIVLAEGSGSDADVWAELAKIPLEPLVPARGLYPRLRSLLVDFGHQLRAEIATQRQHAEARRALDVAASTPHVALDAPRPHRDPDAL